LQHQQSELEKALVGERTKLQSAEEEKQRLHDRLEGLQYQQLELEESLAAEKSEHEALHRDHQILLRRCEDLDGELNSLQELHGAATTAYKAVLDRPLSLKERLLGRREGFSNVTVVRQGGE
jgi:predicted  nucleic acid-binding Zn-ribbon protein